MEVQGGFPDIYVICLASVFEQRGAKTIEFLKRELQPELHASSNTGNAPTKEKVKRFHALTPADINVEDVAAASQLAIIRKRAPRVTHADMNNPAQVACYMSHRAVWKACADAGQPVVVAEDDSTPTHIAGRIAMARSMAAKVNCAKVPLVVLLQHHSHHLSRAACMTSRFSADAEAKRDATFAARHAPDPALGSRVSFFTGAAMYYVTPAAAKLLLKHSMPAAMHVDQYISTCIAAYNLVVFSVHGADDQSVLNNTTLEHSPLWHVVTERQRLCLAVLAVVAVCVLVWAIAVTVYRTQGGQRW